MQTSWGDFAIWDAHVHFFSYRFFESLAAQSGRQPEAIGELLGWRLPTPDPVTLAGEWVKELDRHGLAHASLIASVPGDEASVAAAATAFPDRFAGYFLFDALAPDAPVRLEAAFRSSGLRAVCLFPAMHRYSVQDERVQYVFEAASQRPGTIVFVHAGVLTVGVRKKLGLPSRFDMRYSNPIDLHSIALDFPGVPFVVPHFGAGYFREALMLCDLCPNVYLDTSSSNSWVRYQPEELDLKGVFRRALAVAGPERLLFGSDSSFFPRGWHDEIARAQIEALSDLGIGAEDARLIFGGNLERLLA